MARPKKITDDVGAKVVENPTVKQIAETLAAERAGTGQNYAAALHDYVATKKQIDMDELDGVPDDDLIQGMALSKIAEWVQQANAERVDMDKIFERDLIAALASNPKVYEGTAADAAKIVRLARQIMDASLVP